MKKSLVYNVAIILIKVLFTLFLPKIVGTLIIKLNMIKNTLPNKSGNTKS